jgi:transposase
MANQVAVGIDISKKTMDVAIGHEQSTAIFSNDGAGHQALIAALKNHPVSLIVMEATDSTNWPVPARYKLRDSLSSSSTLGRPGTSPRPWGDWSRPTAWMPGCWLNWPGAESAA